MMFIREHSMEKEPCEIPLSYIFYMNFLMYYDLLPRYLKSVWQVFYYSNYFLHSRCDVFIFMM